MHKHKSPISIVPKYTVVLCHDRGYQNGTTYTAITDINVLHTNGLYYNLKIDWKYNAPDAFFTWKWTINIPNGNTDTVKFYYAMDSSIG